MPWGIRKILKIQKIQEIQDFLDAVGNQKNPEIPGNTGFPVCREESRKSTKFRISWMPLGIQKIQKIQEI